MQATEAHVRAALQQAGFVWELTMPRGADGKLRGFAFAAFTTRAQAEKAITTVNGTVRDSLWAAYSHSYSSMQDGVLTTRLCSAVSSWPGALYVQTPYCPSFFAKGTMQGLQVHAIGLTLTHAG